MKSDKKQSTPNHRTSESKIQCPVAGIGISSEAVESLEQFFENMPTPNGLAFVVIQHSPTVSTEINPLRLQQKTSMKVVEASHQLRVQPETIYILPPGKNLWMVNGYLQVFDFEDTHGTRLPINIFFRSLADELKEKCIGIILAGSGSDGSAGLKYLKSFNGLALVQDPADNLHNCMPHYALEATHVDAVAPAAKLPSLLMQLISSAHFERLPSMDDYNEEIDEIIKMVAERTGHDFSLYKKTALLRRIERRQNALELNSLAKYIDFLKQYPAETHLLFSELIINITGFFRDRQVWERLGEQALPLMFESLPDNYTIRIWVPGCSTGEEAWTLAIVLSEALGKIESSRNITFKIFATDIDTEAIDTARKAAYPAALVWEIDEALLNRYFIRRGDYFYVNNQLREAVIFATHNLVSDPPFTRIDILSCRNLLIYMEQELQNRLHDMFSLILNPAGILVIGMAESTRENERFFENTWAPLRIFHRTKIPSRKKLSEFLVANSQQISQYLPWKEPQQNLNTIDREVEKIILTQHAPAGIVVDNFGNIIYTTGQVNIFLKPLKNQTQQNIYTLAREGIGQHLAYILKNASHQPLTLNNVSIEADQDSWLTDITFRRLENPQILNDYILILFSRTTGKDKPETQLPRDITQLQLQLKQTAMELEYTRQELSTSREEWVALQQELICRLEELQSINQGLIASGEELNNMNRELISLNEELQQNARKHYFESVKEVLPPKNEIATLVLDDELKIFMYNEPLISLFDIDSSSIGQPVENLGGRLKYPEFANDLQRVSRTLSSLDTTVNDNDEKSYNISFFPMISNDGSLQGILVNFITIPDIKLPQSGVQLAMNQL